MGTAENTVIVRQVIAEGWNGRQFAIMDDHYAPDYIHHDPSLPPDAQRGRENYKRGVQMMYSAFPDLRGDIEDIVAEGDKVAIRFRWRGTQTGELMGIPPSGKPVDFAMIEIYRFDDGKIVEGWAVFDALGMMQQIGVVPAPGQAGA